MISIKILFGTDLRRFSFEGNSFEKLEVNIRSIYNVSGKFIVKYQDDEGDWINISSDREFSLALQLLKGDVLKLQIFTSNGDQMEIGSQPNLYPSFANIPANGNNVPNVPLVNNITVPPVNNVIPVNNVPPVTNPVLIPSQSIVTRNDEWKNFKHQKKFEKKFDRIQKKMKNIHEKSNKHGLARLVQESTIPDGNNIPLGSEFVKIWKIRNESSVTWPEGYIFAFKKGNIMSSFEEVKILKAISPGEEFEISITMKAPSVPGLYMSVWRLISGPNGKPFGQPFRVKIMVLNSTSICPTFSNNDRNGCLAELTSMGFVDRQLNEHFLNKFNNDMDKVVWKLLKKTQKKQFRDEKKDLKKSFKNQKKEFQNIYKF